MSLYSERIFPWFVKRSLDNHPARRKWQDRLNPVQNVVGVGRNLNRDTVAAVRAAGFLIGPTPQQIEPAFPVAAYLPVVEGEARKPAS